MQIFISGMPEKVPVELCRKACRYYAKRLLSKRLYDNITIRLIFTTLGLGRTKASCVWNTTNIRPRSFTIIVRADMGQRSTLRAIAHEMVHTKQWATGQLKDYLRTHKKCRWQGEVHPAYDDWNYYFFQPWEIEAYGMEVGLYRTFIKEPQYDVCNKQCK